MENVLTVEEVAKLLKVKPITVREMLRDQRIRGFKVGKAWRTTEAMLAEDLDTISRGEKPKPLEAQIALAAQPKRTRADRKAAPTAVPPVPVVAPTPTPPTKRAAKVVEAEPAAPVAKPSRKAARATDEPEDQQLLF